ncbi:site-specific DNA-methyltransferase [Candidatus Poseidonia alphae]|nr:site-specific DNA-methyltransferase [Candidatus Poseidonia alphae]
MSEGDSSDFHKTRIRSLKEIIPEAFDGDDLNPMALLDALGIELNSDDLRKEKFGLTWSGRRAAAKAATSKSSFTLTLDSEQSVKHGQTNSMFIHGENLEVLKNLNSYYGGIKMIYLDPPYNTGNDFVYEDDFSTPLEKYLAISGQISSDGHKLSTNTETSGRFHSDWLSFIYPRLLLCRPLLKKDGVICVSIDDNEVSNLRMVMNEIFGEENFVSSMVWEGTNKNDAKLVSNNHDYVLVYAKNKAALRNLVKETPWRVRKEGLDDIYAKAQEIVAKYPNLTRADCRSASSELKEWYKTVKNTPSFSHKHYNSIDSKGVYFPSDLSWPGGGGPTYVVIHPETGLPVKQSIRGWIYPKQKTMLEAIENDLVHFGPDETTVPQGKTYLKKTERQVLGSVFYCDRRAAVKRLRKLMEGNEVFDFPKDEFVLMNIIEAFTNPGDIIMDVFGGSGTTGHAVLQLNAESQTTRNFIVATLPEPLNQKVKSGKNAAKLGYQYVSEITSKRLEKASKWAQKKFNPNASIDIGFEVYKLVPKSIDIWNQNDKEQRTLEDFIEKIVEENDNEYPYETITELLVSASKPLTGERIYFDTEAYNGTIVSESTMIIEKITNAEQATSALTKISSRIKTVCAYDRVFSGNDAVKMNFKHILKDKGINFFTR